MKAESSVAVTVVAVKAMAMVEAMEVVAMEVASLTLFGQSATAAYAEERADIATP